MGQDDEKELLRDLVNKLKDEGGPTRYWAGNERCLACGAIDMAGNLSDEDHEDDCAWMRARKHVEGTG